MKSRTSSEPSRWARIAEARGLAIPPNRMENIAAILDDLETKTRQALDHDLSLVEPIFSFRPAISEPAASDEEI